MGPALVWTCESCSGTLLPQRELVALLGHLAASMRGRVDLDQEPEPIPDSGTRLACPSCGKTMEPFGYMETRLVIADRCSDEWLIWADPGELGAMAVLYARTNRRVNRMRGHGHDQVAAQRLRTAAVFKARLERDLEPPGRYDGRAKQWTYLMRQLFGRYDDE